MADEESPESVADSRELRAMLDAARRNGRLAERICHELSGGEIEVRLHLYRGWLALARFQALLGNNDLPAEELTGFVVKMLSPVLTFTDEMKSEEWSDALPTFEALGCELGSVNATEESLELLERHYEFLNSSERAFRRQFLRDHGIAGPSAEVVKWIGFVLILGLMIYGGVRAMRGPVPWRMALFENVEVSGAPKQVVFVPGIDFQWSGKGPLVGFSTDNYSARFDGCLVLNRRAKLRLEAGSDDGSRLFLNGEKLLDKWQASAYTREVSDVELPPGVHHILLDFFQLTGGAQVSLALEIDGQPVEESEIGYIRRPRMNSLGQPVCKK